MREVLLLLAIGLAVGIPAAMLLGRYVSSQLYGIEARDPMIADRHDGPARARVGRRRAHPGAPRQPDRSDPGAAARMRQSRSTRADGRRTARESASGRR